MAHNGIGLNAVAGGKKITGSHWQQSKSTLQKMGNQLKLLRFSPCYKIVAHSKEKNALRY